MTADRGWGQAALLDDLAAVARDIRRDVVEMVHRLGIGYLLQGLGAADIFTALYFGELRLEPAEPAWPGRDRFLLSTAHNTAVFYATLARRGLIPRVALADYTCDGSPLEVNASERLGPVVEATCGSLGQGLSVGVGMALAARRRGLDVRVYAVLGDGELQEGQVWEAAMCAASHGLDNLCVVVDLNRLQVEGHTDQVLRMDPIADKWSAFGWNALELDGNDLGALTAGLAAARATAGRPSVLVAHTVPGAGAPSLAGRMSHIAQISDEEARVALAELGAAA